MIDEELRDRKRLLDAMLVAVHEAEAALASAKARKGPRGFASRFDAFSSNDRGMRMLRSELADARKKYAQIARDLGHSKAHVGQVLGVGYSAVTSYWRRP